MASKNKFDKIKLVKSVSFSNKCETTSSFKLFNNEKNKEKYLDIYKWKTPINGNFPVDTLDDEIVKLKKELECLKNKMLIY